MNTLRALTLCGTVVVVLALAGVAHADEKPLMVTEPVEEVFENPCTGEVVTLTGEQVIMVHQVDDGAGGFHEKFTIHVRGITAIGESGTQYRSVGAHSDYFSIGAGRATTFTFTVAFLVVSKGGADNFLAKATIHATANAKGDVTAEFEEFRVECRG
jgi:hypothetical protein